MLIVEDGSGKSDAESFISVENASAYHTARGNSAWAALASDAVREQCLRKATDYMEQVYRSRWQGYRVTEEQALSWPRSDVYVDGYAIASDIVPAQVANACAELALRASAGDLAPDLDQRIKREKIDVLETEYDSASPQYMRYRAVDNMLAAFLAQMGSSTFRKVVRT